MIIASVILVLYIFFVWIFFFRMKVIKFNVVWGVVSFWIGLHLVLVFVIGLRFCQPFSADVRVVRHTIQIIPRLPHPTTLTEVVVAPNQPVKKGDPLFRFDQTLYQLNVDQLSAELAAAKQNVLMLGATVDEATAQLEQAAAEEKFAGQQVARYADLSKTGAARVEEYQQWIEQENAAKAQVNEAKANLNKAQLAYNSNIDGMNTTVAQVEAELKQAEYYLDQTTIYAPEDGFITNLQARPGLVVGIIRAGAIASFISNEKPYVLAAFPQQHLKFVKPGQPAEIALDFYPGKILTGKVANIWWATGQGQMMPEGRLPNFILPPVRGRFAVEISIDEGQGHELPAGAQGTVAIYTPWNKVLEPFRKIEIRTYSWGRWLDPMPF